MILVTGATRQVGSEVVRVLLEDGQEVKAVIRGRAPRGHAASGRRSRGQQPSNPRTLASARPGVDAIFLNPLAGGDATAELLGWRRT
jgi:uncharacterized protein YbjT (DUF2867 family)